MGKNCLAALLLIAAAGTLTAVPATSVSAAQAQHLQHVVVAAAGSGQVAIPLHLTPGIHTVSEEIPLTAGAHATSVTPDTTTKSVSIRVGTGNCGGYNGNISWNWNWVTGWGNIDTWGIMWDNCN